MKKSTGSSFDSFLEERGIKEDVELLAQKELLAEQIQAGMEQKHITLQKLAESMGTSRTVVYRLLDPKDTGVTLLTLAKVSKALGLQLRTSLEKIPPRKGSPERKRRFAS